ncbi:MAG TPA: carbohydrate ABC transporter permease [Anaerolineales bacterium]|jgi:multiple sugar transport system permease protein|nr:carbohydrate ABC transporter permease [Anaerolineales bacterium]
MRSGKFIRKFFLSLLMLPVIAFIFFPILWLFSASLSNQVELFSVPIHWFPQHPTLQNYADIFFPSEAASSVPRTFALSLLNSFKIASAVTVICLVIGSLAAYALVRIPFKFNLAIQLGIMGTRMIPEVSLIIPLFILASSLQLVNTPLVLILTYMSFALPYAIWMMAAFFQTVPVELEDAARIDGCSRLGILFRIVLPISGPGLVSTGMFVFLVAWDEFFYALIFTNTLAAKTVPVAIAEFIGRYVVNVNGMMAGGILAAIPPVLVALIFQRYIVSGMTAGAVKG